jgi:uncharacterized protein YjbI with pentapeptide repeats
LAAELNNAGLRHAKLSNGNLENIEVAGAQLDYVDLTAATCAPRSTCMRSLPSRTGFTDADYGQITRG